VKMPDIFLDFNQSKNSLTNFSCKFRISKFK